MSVEIDFDYIKSDPDFDRIAERRTKLKEEFIGTIDDNRTLILRQTTYNKAKIKNRMFRLLRRDVPRHITDILEAQIMCKFDPQRMEESRVKVKALLKRNDKAKKKGTFPIQTVIWSDVLDAIRHAILLGTPKDLSDVRKFAESISDSNAMSMIAACAEYNPRRKNEFFLAAMTVRPPLIEKNKAELLKVLADPTLPKANFMRFIVALAESQLTAFTIPEAEMLADKVISMCSDECVVPMADDVDWDKYNSIESAAPFAAAAAKFKDGTLGFMKAFAGRCDAPGTSSIASKVTDLLLSDVSATLPHVATRKILGYILKYFVISVPPVVAREAVVFWQPEFRVETGVEAFQEGRIEGHKNENFAYHECFETIGALLVNFDFSTEGFKKALSVCGLEHGVRIGALSLLYTQRYPELRMFVKHLGSETSFTASPTTFFTRGIAQYRMGELAEATETMLMVFIDSMKKGKNAEAASLYRREKLEGRKRLFDEDGIEIPEPVYMISERDAAYIACQILHNLLPAAWKISADNYSLLFAARMVMCQIDFDVTGREAFESLIREMTYLGYPEFRFPTLLDSISQPYFVKRFQVLVKSFTTYRFLTDVEEKKKVMESTAAKAKERYARWLPAPPPPSDEKKKAAERAQWPVEALLKKDVEEITDALMKENPRIPVHGKFIVCPQQEERSGASTRNKNKIKENTTDKIFIHSFLKMSKSSEDPFTSLHKFFDTHLDDIIKGTISL